MQSTLIDVGAASLEFIGQLGSGQTASPEDGANILRMANLILSQKSTNRLFLYVINYQNFGLTPNTWDYTLGPTGSLVLAQRPTLIESAQILVAGTSGLYLPISILDKPEWDAIRNKGATGDVPDSMYPEYTIPNIGLHINPAPTGSPSLRLGYWAQLTQFATLFDVINFPPAYEEWLEAKLAMRLAPLYDQPVTAEIATRVAEAEAAVQEINAQSIGGAISAQQRLISPNVGQPIVPGAGGQGGQPSPGGGQ